MIRRGIAAILLIALGVALGRIVPWGKKTSRPPKTQVRNGVSLKGALFDPLIANGWGRADPFLKLIFHEHADPESYRASTLISGADYCTASLVGPSVLITSAHCVERYSDTINLPRDGENSPDAWHNAWTAECQRFNKNSGTFGNTDPDVAICHIVDHEATKTDGRFESLTYHLPLADATLFGGWGETERQGSAAGEEFRIGAGVVTLFEDPDTVRVAGSQARVGDSGGPAFTVENGRRFAFAVIARRNSGNTWESYFDFFGAPAVRKFLEDWIGTHHEHVCGVNESGAYCR